MLTCCWAYPQRYSTVYGSSFAYTWDTPRASSDNSDGSRLGSSSTSPPCLVRTDRAAPGWCRGRRCSPADCRAHTALYGPLSGWQAASARRGRGSFLFWRESRSSRRAGRWWWSRRIGCIGAFLGRWRICRSLCRRGRCRDAGGVFLS